MDIYIYSRTFSNGSIGGGNLSTQITIKYLQKLGHNVKSFGNLKELTKALKEYKPDLLLHHNVGDIEKVYVISQKYGVPFIPTLNNNIACLNGDHIQGDSLLKNRYGIPCRKCTFKQALKCTVFDFRYPFWQKIYNTLFILPRLIRIKKRIEILNKCAGVICIGKTNIDLLKENGVKRDILFSPQPVDDENYLSKILPKPHSDKKILVLAAGPQLCITKGGHLIAEAFSKLKRNDVQLMCLRGDMNYWKPEWPKENIVFFSNVSYEKMTEIYRKAHLVFFGDTAFSPYGRVWAESILNGTPVIAFRGRAGASDYLVHKQTGYLVDYDINELVNGINKLLDDSKLWKHIRINSWKYGQDNLLASKVMPKLINYYQKCIDEYGKHKIR